MTRSAVTLRSARELQVRYLGVVSYGHGLELQDELVRRRRAGEIPDQLLLLEHPHVITLGTSARPEHVLTDHRERQRLGIELFETGRGGDVTYHGPGQLVGYPILDLNPDRRELHRYLRDLEQVLVETLEIFGLRAEQRPGLTGVWVGNGKIAAIGVRVSCGWITSHGFALNVNTDLRYFQAIVPCGIHDHPVTSMERQLGRPVALRTVADAATEAFARVFARQAIVV
ncbi:MAG: lipoyl(octanoyl) transferase LipB [Gemmatimonadetes bacterium]|nr:lipoyl(octanoyl) transferase LipB [Gemmatimonadota bacterium]